MKSLSLFKNRDRKSSSWAWPSCNQPKTLSFRASKNDTVLFNSINPTFVNYTTNKEILETSESTLTEFSSFDFKGLCSDRFFFEPNNTNSILEIKEIINVDKITSDNLLSLHMDSRNPREDFKESIVEMVEAHGVNDWESVEKLLSWYLELNEERNYGYIIDAFFDLFVDFDPNSSIHSLWSTSCVSSYSSPL